MFDWKEAIASYSDDQKRSIVKYRANDRGQQLLRKLGGIDLNNDSGQTIKIPLTLTEQGQSIIDHFTNEMVE